MNEIRVEIDGEVESFQLKSSWEEIEQFEELQKAAALIFDLIDTSSAKVELFKALVVSNASRGKLYSLISSLWDLDPGNVVTLIDQVDFVVNTLPSLYESLAAEYREFQGPENGLKNIRWQQFRNAEPYYKDFIESRTESSLNAMLGYLYWKDDYKLENAPKMAKIAAGWLLDT